MHTPGITILHPRFWTLGTVFGTLYPGLWRLGWGVGVIDTYAGCCRWGGGSELGDEFGYEFGRPFDRPFAYEKLSIQITANYR